MKAKLAEVETTQRTKLKAQVAALEAKIANLEEQSENEAKERLLQQKNNRKLEKKIKEVNLNIEDERRHADQFKEQIEKVRCDNYLIDAIYIAIILFQLNNRNKILKRNLDEAEEEIQKEKTQKRKAQRHMEDMLEAQETLTREMNSLKSKLR